MKFILMLLLLFVLTDPVLAETSLAETSLADTNLARNAATQPASNPAQCRDMYRDYMKAYDTGKSVSQKQMLYFVDTCMQEKTGNSYQAYHRKLVQDADDIKQVYTARI